MLSRASRTFQAGKILGNSPERYSGSAMQKPTAALGKGAPPSPAGRRRLSPGTFLPGLKASARAQSPLPEDYFSSSQGQLSLPSTMIWEPRQASPSLCSPWLEVPHQ